jgi:hypothetical protein
MWLSKVVVQQFAGALKYDLALDQSGAGKPSIKAAGYTVNGLRPPAPQPTQTVTASAQPASANAAAAAAKSRDSSGGPLGVIAAVLGVGLLALGAGVAVGRSGRRTR